MFSISFRSIGLSLAAILLQSGCTKPTVPSGTSTQQQYTPQTIYQQYCLRCHGEQLAGGGVGPNLIDDYWIHGDGNHDSLVKVLQEGSLQKGMPAWKDILSDLQINEMAKWISSQKGKTVTRAKAPEGNYVDPKRKP